MLFMSSGCGNGNSSTSDNAEGKVDVEGDVSINLPVPNNQNSEDYKIILYGNSHISGVGSMIKQLIEQSTPGTEVETSSHTGGFLDDFYVSTHARNKLIDSTWTHAIFQGQKYSQSQSRIYSTLETEKWLALAKEYNITPILFPEHPQYGNHDEGEYVHGIHQGIVERQASCLAPVGLVWDRVLSLYPDTALHSPDGNHASYLGTYLTSLVFYEMVSGRSADLLGYNPEIDVSISQQQAFGQIVSQVIEENKACPWS